MIKPSRFAFLRFSCFFLSLVSCAALEAATIVVNTAIDEYGAGASCSLREAIESANDNFDFGGCGHTGVYGDAITDNINLPELGAGGAFTLTRIGEDDLNTSGDLDINGNLRINGFSAANSVIRGDTNDDDDERDRIFHIIGGNVQLNNMTIRDGLVDAGGLGGGLRTAAGTSTTLVSVVVGVNEADGDGGGIHSSGHLTLIESVVSNNISRNPTLGGGGVYATGALGTSSLTLEDSQVFNNRTEGSNNQGHGAGIFAFTELTLDNSAVYSNEVDVESNLGGTARGNGGGVHARGLFTIVNSTIANNIARGSESQTNIDSSGGGFHCEGDASGSITRSLISGNDVLKLNVLNTPRGGGIFSACDLTLTDSVVQLNSSEENAGGFSGQAIIRGSTFISNTAEGAIGGVSLSSGIIENSTISSNTAVKATGGIEVNNGQLRHVTIVSNLAQNADSSSASAGGLRAAPAFGQEVQLASSVIAFNTDGFTADEDCNGTVVSLSYNVVQDGSGCTGLLGGGLDRSDVSAGLESLADNGGGLVGATVGPVARVVRLTRKPQPSSNAVDFVQEGSCLDAQGAPLLVDQLGGPRPVDGPDFGDLATCDSGAIEYTVLLFEDGFE